MIPTPTPRLHLTHARPASRLPAAIVVGAALAVALSGCSARDSGERGSAVPTVTEGSCVIAVGEAAPAYLQALGCHADFATLASEPLDASIPGARSAKVVLDRQGGDQLYYQNTNQFQIHWEFAQSELDSTENPVADLANFNSTEYYSPDRRFVLGAVTHYEGPDTWALELAPYDRADAAMIEQLYRAVAATAYFGPALQFHPQTAYLTEQAAALPADVLIVSTDELYAGIDYQPLNLGETMGYLRFIDASELGTEHVSYTDVVVLDHVPNDINVVAGLITEEFQTPLSHVNVLSRNRGTPNMGLRGATTDAELCALAGKWVHLTVGAFTYQIEEVTAEAARAFIEERKPTPTEITPYDESVNELVALANLVVPSDSLPLHDAIHQAIPIVGGKAAHYSWLAQIGGDVPVLDAFAVPTYFYHQFMAENGFAARVAALLADPSFRDDPAVRDAELTALRNDMAIGTVNQTFQDQLRAKLIADFPDEPTIRFRSSTNAEDLDGFTGAGLYTSKTGTVADWPTVLSAIRKVWASVWNYRAFDEREFRGIPHQQVAMALLVHPNFPEEEANGVAITNNPFDPSGLNPAFYVNVQRGDASVVQPDVGVTTDELIYYYASPNQPVVYRSESNLVDTGSHVLTAVQINQLGRALDAVHAAFSAAYGPASGRNDTGWYAMDTEFKFDDRGSGGQPQLYLKQARPYPGREP